MEEFLLVRWESPSLGLKKEKSNIPEISVKIIKNWNLGDEPENKGNGSDESEDVELDFKTRYMIRIHFLEHSRNWLGEKHRKSGSW